MKAKVRLTHTVEMFVEANTEDEILEWLNQTTPRQAVDLVEENDRYAEQDYSEEIVCFVVDESEVDYVISKEEE